MACGRTNEFPTAFYGSWPYLGAFLRIERLISNGTHFCDLINRRSHDVRKICDCKRTPFCHCIMLKSFGCFWTEVSCLYDLFPARLILTRYWAMIWISNTERWLLSTCVWMCSLLNRMRNLLHLTKTRDVQRISTTKYTWYAHGR